MSKTDGWQRGMRQQHRQHSPVRSPECRQRQPSAPALPVPSTVTSRMETAALGTSVIVENHFSDAWQNPETDVTGTYAFITRIERPPKPA